MSGVFITAVILISEQVFMISLPWLYTKQASILHLMWPLSDRYAHACCGFKAEADRPEFCFRRALSGLTGDRWDSLLFSGTMLQPAGETPEQHTCLRGCHVAPSPPSIPALFTSLLTWRASLKFVNSLSLHFILGLLRPGPHAVWGGAQACSRADCLRIRPTVLWNQALRQAQC